MNRRSFMRGIAAVITGMTVPWQVALLIPPPVIPLPPVRIPRETIDASTKWAMKLNRSNSIPKAKLEEFLQHVQRLRPVKIHMTPVGLRNYTKGFEVYRNED